MAEETRSLLSSGLKVTYDGIITHKCDSVSLSNDGFEVAQGQNGGLEDSHGQNGGLDGSQGQNINGGLDGSQGQNGGLDGSQGQNRGVHGSQSHNRGLEISQGQQGGLDDTQGHTGGIDGSHGHNGGLESSLALTDGPNAPQGHNQETSPPTKSADDFSFRRLSSRKMLTFLLLGLTVFSSTCCFSLLAPFFPTVAESKGMSPTWIGLVLSCFELWIFVSSPVFSMYISRFGAVRLFIGGQFVAGISSALFGFLNLSPPGHVFTALCLLVRTVKALGASAMATASIAVIAMEFPAHISTVFSIIEIFTGFGFIAGPLLGAALYETSGFGLPFWVMGVFMLLCGLLTALLMPVRSGGALGKRDGLILPLISSPLSAVATLSVVFTIFTWGTLDATLAIHVAQFNISITVLGLLLTIAAAIYSLTSPFYGWLSDSKNITFPVLIYGNVGLGISLLIMGPSPLLPFLSTNLWQTVVGLVGIGLLSGPSFLPAIKCLYTAATHKGLEKGPDLDGAVSGIFTSAFHLGGFIGPTVGSAVLETAGYGWSTTVNAFLLFFSALCVSVYVIATRTCHKRHDEYSKMTSPKEHQNQETSFPAP